MNTRLRKAGVVAGGVASLATWGVIVPGPAMAGRNPCSAEHHNYDPRATTVIDNNYLHTGPYAACPHVAHPGVGRVVYLHCRIDNDYGNGWDWVRIKGTNTQGWISEEDLNYPSLKICNPWS